MEFPLNKQVLDPDYMTNVLESKSIELVSTYASFHKYSSRLVISFHRQIDKYGSIHFIPSPVLREYHEAFSELFIQFRTLGSDLQIQANENTKYLDELMDSHAEDSCLYELYSKKQDRLQQKIKYYDSIHVLFVAIEYCLEYEF